MNFGDDLEPLFIFAGLAFLLLIGPLLKWYVLGMTKPNFKLPENYFVELIPFGLIFISSFFITKQWFESNNKEVIILFASVLIFIYLHFAFYIFISWRALKNVKKNHEEVTQTKSQKAIFDWLRLLIIGFVIIFFMLTESHSTIVQFKAIIEELKESQVFPILEPTALGTEWPLSPVGLEEAA